MAVVGVVVRVIEPMTVFVVMAVVVPAAGAVHVGTVPMVVVVVQVFTVDMGVVRAAAASHAHGFLLGNGVSM
jgi:hypothetical protein